MFRRPTVTTLAIGEKSRRPVERAFVAALTVFVIYGLIATEIVVVLSGGLPAWRMAPTWVLQIVLLVLFAGAYHYQGPERWRRRMSLQGSHP